MQARLRRAAIATVLGVVLSASPLTTSAALAAEAAPWYPRGRTLTWVDGQGRQVTALQVLRQLDPPQPVWDVIVLRDLATGQPDPAWVDADGPPGRRTLALTTPAPGAELEETMAADGLGGLTIAWRAQGCAATAVCTRWFQDTDVATGALSVTERAEVAPLRTGLPDASLLTGEEGGQIGRRGPDGAAWPVPGLAVADVQAATVDQLGRPLLARADGRIVRQGIDGTVELDVASGCAAGSTIAIGPSAADDGFATSCGDPGAEIETTRWSPAGVALWTVADGIAPGSTTDLSRPNHAVVALDGSVWVGGIAALDTEELPGLAGTVVARFTAAGPQAPAHVGTPSRPSVLDGFGVGDLRPVLDGRVAYASDLRCCQTAGGPLPFDRVESGVLPERPSPPTCVPGLPFVVPSTSSTPVVNFRTCDDSQRAVEQPTSYRVELIGPSRTRTATVGYHVASTDVAAVVTQVRGGEVLTPRAIAVNAQGDSLGGAATGAKVILPFASVERWAQQQYLDLLPGPAWAAERASVVAALDAGSLAPADLVASLLERGVAEHRVEPVARTYQAALGRLPDTGGLRYWTGRSAAGVRLAQIAQTMSTSPEFVRRYGGLSNRGFVLQVYRNVLDREGDAPGVAYWTRRMDAGLTRGGLVAQFAQSSELVRRTDPTIQPLAAAFLLFGRVPTPEERTAWATTTPRTTAARAILPTATYARRFLDGF
jgi:hypothetical protein